MTGIPTTIPTAPPAGLSRPHAGQPPIPGESSHGNSHVARWPLWLLALPAVVAIWSGWVGLGGMAGFGVVHPLPGIADDVELNTAITLPIGMEVYAAYALRAWLSGSVPERARRFARRSAVGALLVGAAGQIAYHLMTAAHWVSAPWPVVTAVSCVPIAVLGMGAALAHLLREPGGEPTVSQEVSPRMIAGEPVSLPGEPPHEPVSPNDPPGEPTVSREPDREPPSEPGELSGEPAPIRVMCGCGCGELVSRATDKRHRKAARERGALAGRARTDVPRESAGVS